MPFSEQRFIAWLGLCAFTVAGALSHAAGEEVAFRLSPVPELAAFAARTQLAPGDTLSLAVHASRTGKGWKPPAPRAPSRAGRASPQRLLRVEVLRLDRSVDRGGTLVHEMRQAVAPQPRHRVREHRCQRTAPGPTGSIRRW